jgi:patatin-related protein
MGSLLDLIRNPRDKNPPSLLYGDGRLFPCLRDSLKRMGEQGRAFGPKGTDQEPPATTVFMTTTFLTGEVTRFVDSCGTIVQDTDHHGLFTFGANQLSVENGGRSNTGGAKLADVAARLALAGRCSSSFPGAFEPSLLPYQANPPDPDRPNMDGFANITRSHWTADGGLLSNRPIGPMLQTIFDRPAQTPVRRVLLYVVPSTGPADDPIAGQAVDDLGQMPAMPEALAKDLGAVVAQSISGDLRTIREHNNKVGSAGDTRRYLADLANRAGVTLVTDAVSLNYTDKMGTALAQPVVDAVMRLISSLPPPSKADPAAQWDQPISGYTNIEEQARATARAAITAGWDVPIGAERAAESGERDRLTWQQRIQDFTDLEVYGRPAFDAAKSTVLTIIRLAHALDDGRHGQRLHSLRAAIHAAFSGVRPRPDLDVITRETYEDFALLGSTLSTVSTFAAEVARRYYHELSRRCSGADTNDGRDGGATATIAGSWAEIARALVANFGILWKLAGAPQARAETRTAGAHLATYLTYLGGGRAGIKRPTPWEVARSLFELHVAQRVVGPVSDTVEQRVDLVQVSADTRTLLDLRRRTAASKLTGMQLQHFGAFYKSSWRANDWMWGRIDGAGWLVNLLLDPQRLLEVARSRGIAAGARVDSLMTDLVELAGDIPNSLPTDPDRPLTAADTIREELRYLDTVDAMDTADGESPNDGAARIVPSSLPSTALWVASAVQRQIAVEELPVIASAIATSVSNNEAHWQHGEQEWVLRTLRAAGPTELVPANVRPAADARRRLNPGAGTPDRDLPSLLTIRQMAPELDDLVTQFADNPVPDQTFQTEIGQPLLARTITKSLATSTAAATTAAKDPTAIKPLLSSLRGITLTGYQATAATKATPRALIGVGLGLIVAGLIVAMTWGSLLGLGGVGACVAGLGLTALGVWGVSRRGLAIYGGALLLLVLLAPAFQVTRSWLYGTDPDFSSGVLSGPITTLPRWLANTWWHTMSVLVGTVVIVVLLLALGQSRRTRRLSKLIDHKAAVLKVPSRRATPSAVGSGSTAPLRDRSAHPGQDVPAAAGSETSLPASRGR